MATVLEEIRDRNSKLFDETASGNYREIDRKDLYRDIHTLAKRLHELEEVVKSWDMQVVELPAVSGSEKVGGQLRKTE